MNNAVQVIRTLFLRLRFIFVFIAIALLVGNWAWIQNVVDRLTRPASVDVTMTGDVEWFCPMHPTVVRSTPEEWLRATDSMVSMESRIRTAAPWMLSRPSR